MCGNLSYVPTVLERTAAPIPVLDFRAVGIKVRGSARAKKKKITHRILSQLPKIALVRIKVQKRHVAPLRLVVHGESPLQPPLDIRV